MSALLFFVTPAFQRYELSEICFAERKWAIEQLAANGIEARSVIVADDENLDIARENGFDTVESINDWLGKRFNDGYQYAAEQGATHVFPIGSDSWVDPKFIYGKLHDNLDVVASRYYARVDRLGIRRKVMWVPVLQGVSYVMPTKALAGKNYRPCADRIRRGCDGSTWQTISRVEGVQMVWSEVHDLETIAFESNVNISTYEGLGTRWGISETDQPFSGLIAHYPHKLVDQIGRYYDEHRDERMLELQRKRMNGANAIQIANDALDRVRTPSAHRKAARAAAVEAVKIVLEDGP